MRAEDFVNVIGSEFFTGVPDSQLKALCDYLMFRYGIDERHHVVAANEGNCVGIASGYYLATGKIPVVYMQNSGEGNAINPIASLLSDEVYAIPMIFVIGWRGEPGIHDEPQHVYQGKITLKLLEDMDITYCVVDSDTSKAELQHTMEGFQTILAKGKSVALVVRKNALINEKDIKYSNPYSLCRETVINKILDHTGNDFIISTTGKISRELYELRQARGEGHQNDFLTVGSMGHSSSIALGVAVNRPEKKIWCIDGDGAMLMHMGAVAVIGSLHPHNLIHIVLNNGSHETVGGMPTVASNRNLADIAKACGYEYAVSVENEADLNRILREVQQRKELTFVEIKCAIGSRKDLGRPAEKPKESKEDFMGALNMSC